MFGKSLVDGKAKIIADEGMTGFTSTSTGFGTAWVHCKYIVEVQPETGAAFRAETKARVPYLGGPNDGDVVNCRYDPDSHKVELVIDGDPRYDPKLLRKAEKAQREELLNATPGSTPAPASSGYTPLDPELQALMDADEAERAGAVPAASPAPAAPAATPSALRLDQLKQLGELHKEGMLTDAEFEQEKARILAES